MQLSANRKFSISIRATSLSNAPASLPVNKRYFNNERQAVRFACLSPDARWHSFNYSNYAWHGSLGMALISNRGCCAPRVEFLEKKDGWKTELQKPAQPENKTMHFLARPSHYQLTSYGPSLSWPLLNRFCIIPLEIAFTPWIPRARIVRAEFFVRFIPRTETRRCVGETHYIYV